MAQQTDFNPNGALVFAAGGANMGSVVVPQGRLNQITIREDSTICTVNAYLPSVGVGLVFAAASTLTLPGTGSLEIPASYYSALGSIDFAGHHGIVTVAASNSMFGCAINGAGTLNVTGSGNSFTGHIGQVRPLADMIINTGELTFGANVTAQHIHNISDNDSTIVLKPGCVISLDDISYENHLDHDMQFVLHAHTIDELEFI